MGRLSPMSQFDLFKSGKSRQLTLNLFQAYFDARRNKRSTVNALRFEMNFEPNLFELAEEILSLRYKPKPSICFIVDKPVKREIFAADFRDRIVHHLIYNHISPIFERTFIHDSYSCRKGKGTHYGIRRIDYFIRSCTRNYTRDAYILKLDIRGYFMAIDKNLLLRKIEDELFRHAETLKFDLDILHFLLFRTIFNDPTVNCIVKGRQRDWIGLPTTKSLFGARSNCGLPIGNLTSQLFANIYLNEFDQYVKRDLGIRCFGRYVDDFVMVHNDREYLRSVVPVIKDFLNERLHLDLHPDKIYLQHYSKGVEYLGTVIKPHRIYVTKRIKGNFYQAIENQNAVAKDHKPDREEVRAFLSSMNSYLGIMKHYKTSRLRKSMITRRLSGWWWNHVRARDGFLRLEMT